MNCACDEQIVLNDVVDEINKILGINIEAIYAEKRISDIEQSYADISLIKQILNFKSIVNFQEGLKNTVNYFK